MRARARHTSAAGVLRKRPPLCGYCRAPFTAGIHRETLLKDPLGDLGAAPERPSPGAAKLRFRYSAHSKSRQVTGSRSPPINGAMFWPCYC